MTQKEIDAVRATLPSIMMPRTPEQQRLIDELDCRDMINSCLIYGQGYDFYNTRTGNFGQYAMRYIKYLGVETVKRLWDEQCADFAKAIVRRNVYQDSEGCTYNSCIWADEQNIGEYAN